CPGHGSGAGFRASSAKFMESSMKTSFGRTALLAAAFSFASFAAISAARADRDPAKETATAATHAGLAAKATDLKGTQMHLHHVVNCLVGPKGKGFDAAPGNPCKDQGNGAIADTKNKKQNATQIQTMLTPKA